MTTQVNLAADYGWGPETLLLIFIIVVTVAAIGFVIVSVTTRMKRKQTFASKKTYRFESFWAIGTAIVLIWLWITSYPWIPPVSFSSVQNSSPTELQTVHITAGQWYWLLSTDEEKSMGTPAPSSIRIQANKPVKFVAHSLDVNHGFGIFGSKQDGSPILLQMQIVPGFDNIFYYTFKNPGTYFIRCLEYCGYGHPYMTTSIEVTQSTPGSSTIKEKKIALADSNSLFLSPFPLLELL
jgi:cytochrome c oxidase subunit 2